MTIPATLLLLGVHTEHTGFVAAGNTPILITSDSTPDVNTGDTAVVTVTKTGGTGDIDFEIIGGADALLFTINDETGALAFRAASVDGTYEVIVRAFSDWGSATQTITVTVATPSYTGPLDLVPGAVVAYGQRAMAAANIGSAVYTIRRDSDDHTQVFVSGADGSVDAAAVTAFLGGANGFVATWNDQGGNGDNVSNATAANQPDWLDAQFSSVPALGFGGDASKRILITAGNVTLPNGAFTIFAVMKNITAPATEYLLGENYFIEDAPDTEIAFAIATGFKIYVDAYDLDETNEAGGRSNVFADATSAAIYEAAWEFGTRNFLVNGNSLGSSASFDGGSALGSISRQLAIGFADAGVLGDLASYNNFFQGTVAEILIYPTLLSAPNRLLIRQNMATYYGITL